MTPPPSSTIAPPPSSGGVKRGAFPSTRWSIISAARDGKGLESLAENYWRPLYAYLRKRGENHDDASDQVQGFFEFVLSGDFLSYVRRDRGKFRSYLLKSLELWRSRRRTHDSAQKRGGHVAHVSLDELEEARTGYGDEQDEARTAVEVYDHQWATNLIAVAVKTVREDYRRRDREQWFERLAAALPGGGILPPYTKLADQLGASEGAIKKAVFDLRANFATKLRAEIRSTVSTNEEAEEELRYLMSVVSA